MAILLKTEADPPERWIGPLRAIDPDLDIRVWPDLGRADEIDIAMVWDLPPGAYGRLPNLKAVLSLGMGVDHLIARADIPADVAIVRLTDPWMAAAMTEYVLLHVLRFHRNHHLYERAQAAAEWLVLPTPEVRSRRVGIMGLGVLGQAAARALCGLGFAVSGWSRRRRSIPEIDCFSGQDGLDAFLDSTEILLCLLPLTAATENILDARLFRALPAGAALINAARGALLVDDDLIAALDSGHLTGATLDAFRNEPLPPTHAFWRHPGIFVTPHMAADSNPETAAQELIANVRRIRGGQTPHNVVDRADGY